MRYSVDLGRKCPENTCKVQTMKMRVVKKALFIVLLGASCLIKADRSPAYFVGTHRLCQPAFKVRPVQPRYNPFNRHAHLEHDEYLEYREYGPVGLYRFKSRHITAKERRLLLKERVSYLERKVREFKRNQESRDKALTMLERNLLKLRVCKGKNS